MSCQTGRTAEAVQASFELVGCRGDLQLVALPDACSVSIPATRGTGIPSAKIRALYGDCAETGFAELARNRRFCRRSARVQAIATIAVAMLQSAC